MIDWRNKIERDWWNAEVEKDLDRWRRVKRVRKSKIIEHVEVNGVLKDSRFAIWETMNWWWKMQTWKLKMRTRWRKAKIKGKVALNRKRNWNCSSESTLIKERERSMVEGYGRKRIIKKKWIRAREIIGKIKAAWVLR